MKEASILFYILLFALFNYAASGSGRRPKRNSGLALPPELDMESVDGDPMIVQHRSTNNVPYRLPDTLKPIEYFIKIDVRGSRTGFKGHVAIEMFVTKPTNKIILHMDQLTLLRDPKIVSSVNKVETALVLLSQKYIQQYQMMVLTLKNVLQKGETCVLRAEYTGVLFNNTFGLNSMHFKDGDGTSRHILATYLQPIGARRIFPCMDEPQLKARFTIHICRRTEETTLSNMMVNRSTTDKDDAAYVWDEFEKSLLMSTYLVAFVVCDLPHFTFMSNDGTSMRVWGRDSVLSDATRAALIASESLSTFKSILGIQYPLTKLDYVALPMYPVPGMENFGLVVLREDSLATNSLLYRKEWVSTVVAHETAHQWIGNLVTPSWWSQYWLSEGFATYLAAVALEQLDPSLEAMNHLLVRETAWVRKSDNGDQSTSLVISPYDPLTNQLKNIPIYYKGAAIIRMLRHILGEDAFDLGLKTFFRQFQFKSIDQYDLFNVLASVAKQYSNTTSTILPAPLSTIMDTWTLQKGYPLLTVRRLNSCTYSVKQQLFVNLNPTSRTTSPFKLGPKSVWWVPLTYGTKTTFRCGSELWLPPSTAATTLINTAGVEDWIILNSQQVAYLRVKYDWKTWSSIIKQLIKDHTVIPVLNRAQLVDDALYLFKKGHVKVDYAMTVLSYLSRERSIFPWMAAFNNLKNIELLIRNEKDYPIFQEYILSQLLPVLADLGLENKQSDSHVRTKHRLLCLSWACKLQHPPCVSLAREAFHNWKQDPTNLRIFPEFGIEEYLCAGIASGDRADWQFAFNQFVLMRQKGKNFISSNPWSRPEYFLPNALACSTDIDIITNYMEIIMDPKYNLTYDDATIVYNSLVRSQRWGRVSWEFLRRNFQKIAFRFGNLPIPFIINRVDLFQIHHFKKQFKGDPTYTNYFDSTIEESRQYVAVNEKIIHSVTRWLRDYKAA